MRALEEASGSCAIKGGGGGGLARSKFTTMALRFEFKSYPLSLLAVAHVRHSCSAVCRSYIWLVAVDKHVGC